jgi:hypothetical protein
VYPDPTSDTGFSAVDLQFPQFALYVAAVATAAGSTTVYASGTDDILYSLNPSSDPANPSWTRVALPSGPDMVCGLKAALDGSGNPFLVLLGGFSQPVMGPSNGFWMLQGGVWSGGQTNVFSTDRRCWCPAIVNPSAPAPGVYFLNESVTPPLYFTSFATFSPAGLNVGTIAPGAYSMVAAAQGGSGVATPILSMAANSSAGPFVCAADPSGRIVPTQISYNLNLTDIAAAVDRAGQLAVLTLDVQGYLYHQFLNAQGWSQWIQLSRQLTFTALHTIQIPGGSYRIVAYGSDDTVYQIYQDPDTTDWFFNEIEFSLPGNIECFTAYRSQIKFYDNNGAFVSDATVQLESDQALTMMVNGVMAALQPNTPFATTTDQSGCVTISYQTSGLGVPAISIWSSFMSAGDAVALDPSGPAQATLAGLSSDGSTLAHESYIDSHGNPQPLWTGTLEEAANVSQAVVQAMTITGPTTAPTPSRYLHRKNDFRAARVIANGGGLQPGQIDVQNVPPQDWEVAFDTSGPVFQKLNADQLAQRRAARANLPRLGNGAGNESTWGDVLSAIGDAFYSVASFVVEKVAGGIQVSMTLVYKGAQILFETIVGWVRQIVDLISVVFEAVGIAFDKLFGWLGYLFNWTDILIVKNGIKNLMSVSFDVLSQVILWAQQQFSETMQRYNSQIDGYFQGLIAKLGLSEPLSVLDQAESIPSPVDLESVQSKNVVVTGFFNNAAQAKGPSSLQLTALDDPISILLETLRELAATYQEGGSNYQNFQQAIGYFETMADELFSNPDQALLNAIAGMLQTFSALAQAALSTLDALISALLKVLSSVIVGLKNLLAEAWTIPFVSDLYSWATHGSQLSAFDLSALIIAVPATIAYKITDPGEPIPDLTQITAAEILSMLGIQPSASAAAGPVTRSFSPPPPVSLLKLMFHVNFFASLGYALVNAKLDSSLVTLPDALIFSVANLVLEGGLIITGMPWWSLTAPATSTVVAWGLTWFGYLFDAIIFAVHKQVPEIDGDPYVYGVFALGVVYVVGNAVAWGLDSENWGSHMAQLVGSLPECFKLMRLKKFIGPPPPKEALAVVEMLAAVDICLITAGAILEWQISLAGLPGNDTAKGALSAAFA